MKKISDTERMDWMIQSGFIAFLGINGYLFGARKAIDDAMRIDRSSRRRKSKGAKRG